MQTCNVVCVLERDVCMFVQLCFVFIFFVCLRECECECECVSVLSNFFLILLCAFKWENV